MAEGMASSSSGSSDDSKGLGPRDRDTLKRGCRKIKAALSRL